MTRDGKLVLLVGLFVCAAVLALAPASAHSHGNVNPQPVDTTGLKPLGGAWREANPFRGNQVAIRIGKSAYGQQCARCHGIDGVSGGLAPDLRYLENGDEGDKVFLPTLRHGAYRDGRTLMPKFEGVMSQEAMWAIRSYLETIHVD